MKHCQGAVEKQLGKFTLNGPINICLRMGDSLIIKTPSETRRSVAEMVFTQEMWGVDRELFLELAESGINLPLFTDRKSVV